MGADTREVSPALTFDASALAEYLRRHLRDLHGPLSVAQFEGGQSNPTYLLTAADGRRLVLRRKPPGKLLPSAHAVDREFRVMRALGNGGFPVPQMRLLCLEEGVIGTPFYVMDFVEGRILWDPFLPGMPPAGRAAIYDEMNRVIAALHGLDPAARGLADYGKPRDYIARQIARWTQQYRASETETIPAMDKLIDWLPAHVPPGDETAIVHGDYRIDNVVFDPARPRILAVLDWELSTLGHPLADFAYHCMVWRLEPGQFRGLAGGDLRALGIPAEADYVARYCERTGRATVSAGDWEFYMAFNMFRLAGILQGVLARALQGNASSAHALDAGRRARPLAQAAWAQVERVFGH